MLPFGIGFSEIVLIAIVLLLVVGPNRLPDLAKTVGKGIRSVRRAGADLRNAVDVEEVRQIRRDIYGETRRIFDDPPLHDDPPYASIAEKDKELVAASQSPPVVRRPPVVVTYGVPEAAASLATSDPGSVPDAAAAGPSRADASPAVTAPDDGEVHGPVARGPAQLPPAENRKADGVDPTG